LLAATLYQGNPEMNHKLWNMYHLRDIHTPYAGAAGMLLPTYKWKVHKGKIEIISFVVKFHS
jgi:hypothetical protein